MAMLFSLRVNKPLNPISSLTTISQVTVNAEDGEIIVLIFNFTGIRQMLISYPTFDIEIKMSGFPHIVIEI